MLAPELAVTEIPTLPPPPTKCWDYPCTAMLGLDNTGDIKSRALCTLGQHCTMSLTQVANFETNQQGLFSGTLLQPSPGPAGTS